MKEILLQGETVKCDVVVIGAGAAGLAAAVTAARDGAKVMVFEKMAAPGGASNFAEGMFAVETRHQKMKNIGITKDEAFRNIMEYSHWRANSRLVRAFVDKSSDTIEWLEKQGIEFTDVRTTARGGMMTWHMLKGRGASVIRALSSNLRDKGGFIYRSANGEKIIIDEKGRAAGLMVRNRKGQIIQVNAKVVVITTGGFANNKKMLVKYTNFGSTSKLG
jgi:fumarate reductase flavoprotein subunit